MLQLTAVFSFQRYLGRTSVPSNNNNNNNNNNIKNNNDHNNNNGLLTDPLSGSSLIKCINYN